MAAPNSRQTLIDYCLRKLGAPVLEINVDEDQISDRVDEALQFYQEYHSDAIYKVYHKHQITTTDITNEYITLPDAVLSVQRIFPLYDNSASGGMFNANYQMHLNDMYALGFSGNLANFAQTKSYLATMDMMMNGPEHMRFSRHMNRLFLDIDWETDVALNDYIVVDAYRIVDPATHSEIYNDMLLKRYTTSLIKQQWGANLIKFEGMQLPGGVTLNGRQIYDDAVTEINAIEEEMQLKYEMPPEFYVG
jgi:hypothetical protein|tara:strand:+ start:138 stop:884 length:747 start_codon:yes stop_codon:yes gene_type:complete